MQESEKHWRNEIEKLELIEKRTPIQNKRLKELQKRIEGNSPQKAKKVDDITEDSNQGPDSSDQKES